MWVVSVALPTSLMIVLIVSSAYIYMQKLIIVSLKVVSVYNVIVVGVLLLILLQT